MKAFCFTSLIKLISQKYEPLGNAPCYITDALKTTGFTREELRLACRRTSIKPMTYNQDSYHMEDMRAFFNTYVSIPRWSKVLGMQEAEVLALIPEHVPAVIDGLLYKRTAELDACLESLSGPLL